MSTIDRPERRVVPPLVAGQRLDQPTFHERYEAMSPETQAELIGGVVSMPSPSGYEHGRNDFDIAGWLFHYRRFTPGLASAGNVTTILGPDSEVQPDSQLRIPAEAGGGSRIVDGYVHGPPELIVEVAKSSRDVDLGSKKRDYERAGVLEYLVVELDSDRIHWFQRRRSRYVLMRPGPDGLYRSKVFPGLWLDAAALFAGDLERIIAALEKGLATSEHAEFVARLTAAGLPKGRT